MADRLHKSDIDFNKRLNFLILSDKMKSIYRRTHISDNSRCETDAEHSWHIALMAVILSDYAPKGTDINRVIKMLLIHDLVEIFAGDTFCYDENAVSTQENREEEAAKRLFSLLPDNQSQEFYDLWREFDNAKTPDASFASSLDRFQPVINNFLTDFPTWQNGKASSDQILKRNNKSESVFPEAWDIITKIIKYAKENGIFDTEY